MKASELRLFMGEYIVASDISKKDKLQLLEFAKTASEEQLSYLLLTGKPVKNVPLSEQDENPLTRDMVERVIVGIINITREKLGQVSSSLHGTPDFSNYLNPSAVYDLITSNMGKALGLHKIYGAGAVHGVGATLLAVLLVRVSSMIYKRFLSKAAKVCSDKSGEQKTLCMKQYKANLLKAQLKYLGQSLAACNKAKKPEVCKRAIQKKINSIKAEFGELGHPA